MKILIAADMEGITGVVAATKPTRATPNTTVSAG